MMGMRTTELLIIFAVILLLFGASRLPQLGKSLGSGIRNFKRGLSDEDDTASAQAGTEAGAKEKEA